MRGTTVRDPGGLLDLVVIQAADLEALPLPTKRVIEVVGHKPYALLVEALARSGWLAAPKQR
ncbi:hypothetical protein [Streptomyces sp. C10]|uniref:hypothetical protein n=1 Tax=Streptomyces sp. C10 TaxID=531941 RepID=UPI00397F541F